MSSLNMPVFFRLPPNPQQICYGSGQSQPAIYRVFNGGPDDVQTNGAGITAPGTIHPGMTVDVMTTGPLSLLLATGASAASGWWQLVG
jgi:hypothetical protein